MFFTHFSSPQLEQLIHKVQGDLAALILKLEVENEPQLIERNRNLTELCKRESCLLLINSGEVDFSIEGKSCLTYEEGDLIGIECQFPISGMAISKDFAIKATAIPWTLIESSIGHFGMLELTSNFSAIFMQAYALSLPEQSDFEPNIKRYQKGEVILEQGSFGDEIYTLIEGHADALVDGKKVGEVQCEEVFGSLAALSNIARTATIVSSSKSLVLGINKDRLIELIKIRPGTIEKLIGDLARVIQDLNSKLTNVGGDK